MTRRLDELALLVCPTCRTALHPSAEPAGRGADASLRCGGACPPWPVRDGMPFLGREEWVRGTDRLMRLFYDGLPRLHDPAVRFLLPLMQGAGTEDSLRDGYIRRLELGALPVDRPARILEVSVGTGANLPRLEAALPPALRGRVEIWGLDLATGMLAGARRRIRRLGYDHVRLVQGDAHTLPFADHAFDRVFHVGGIGGFRDPAAALAEMARVARPGTPIVVVDEQLEPGLGPLRWALFRALTFYDPAPHCPVEALPANAIDVLQEQVSRFYYSLRFRMPA